MPADAPFGQVHLGETFYSFLLIRNEGLMCLHELQVKVELQTATQRCILMSDRIEGDNKAPSPSTQPPATDFSLESGSQLRVRTLHDIREVGVHILVCSVQWLNPVTNEVKFLRKFFRFSAANPLTLKTKVTERPEYLLVEAQVQNVSTTGFILERMAMEPSKSMTQDDGQHSEIASPSIMSGLVTCHTIDVLYSGADGLAVDFERLSLPSQSSNNTIGAVYGPEVLPDKRLGADEMFQYVFVVTLPPFPTSRDVPLPMGHLDISWKSETGEQGRLQTGTLLHHWEVGDDPNKYSTTTDNTASSRVQTICKGVPPQIARGQAFDMLVIIQNYHQDSSLSEVTIGWDPPPLTIFPGLVPEGPVRVKLGEVTALNSARVVIRVVAAGTEGMHEGASHFYLQYRIAPSTEDSESRNNAELMKGEYKNESQIYRFPLRFSTVITAPLTRSVTQIQSQVQPQVQSQVQYL